ncbi:MAG TPA: CopG family transcriptional regulator [Cyanobacteria bacterium UBA11368]|nr:CopG family transcriptional regulator [Cyanobacteria bacterium UBA11368]
MTTLTRPETLPKTNLRRVTAYIDPALYTDFEKLAEADSRTISQMIAVLIKEAVKNAKDAKRI